MTKDEAADLGKQMEWSDISEGGVPDEIRHADRKARKAFASQVSRCRAEYLTVVDAGEPRLEGGGMG